MFLAERRTSTCLYALHIDFLLLNFWSSRVGRSSVSHHQNADHTLHSLCTICVLQSRVIPYYCRIQRREQACQRVYTEKAIVSERWKFVLPVYMVKSKRGNWWLSGSQLVCCKLIINFTRLKEKIRPKRVENGLSRYSPFMSGC